MSGHKRGEEDLKGLLKERAEIDGLLKNKFSREMTIMFTDIKGSTTFFETRGDIDGLSMVYQHNELLFPTVECHQGKVVKTIGDSIMASFPDAVEGVRAAIEMQRKLSVYNSTQPEINRIQIRIGLNAGRGIVEHQDVFGDFVNLAARIESLADAGQILISQKVYEVVKQKDDIICRYFDCTKVKGKKEPIKVYRVVWGEEELIPGTKRSAAPAEEKETVSDKQRSDLRDIAHESVDLKRRKQFIKKALFSAIVPFLLIVLILGLIVVKSTPVMKDINNSPYQLAYRQLGEGKLKEARKGFEQIKNDDALHFEGLAAVCFREGDYEKSLLLCDRALKLNRDNLYSHVIKGNIFLHQGKISDAAVEYDKATQLTQGADWQRAEAYNRRGRIYAAEQRVEKALSFYTQAAVYNPGSPEIYTNQGILSEKEGDLTGALSFYKKALEVKPDDPIAKLLFKEASDKKGLVEDDERRQRVDRLVAELIETYRKKKEQGSGEKEDHWTSRPLTLSFLDFQKKGIPSLRDGEDECLMLNITSRLQEEGRIQIVERALLDTLLEELKLGSSALADPELALRVGRIVAARLVVTGSITRYGNNLQVALRLIDPETTAVKATIMEGAEKGTDIGELSERIAQRIIGKLNSDYPLRGEIISLKGDDLILNIGSDQGVKSGSIMSIVAEMKPVQLKGRQVVPRGREIGKVEVTSVESSLAHAKIIEKQNEIQKGFKVEEFTTQNKQRTPWPSPGKAGREQEV
jgi:class 3 adenylate cyclase/Flp pilus assembly protein TadD